MEKQLKYLVIGAGGTGGSISAFLAGAKKQVTLIARGEHLKKIREKGLRIIGMGKDAYVPVNGMEEAEFQGKADVIFVCVKGYSLKEIYPLIRRASHEKTVIIPILNIYGTGERMAEAMPELEIVNGCIYIAAAIEEPGVIRLSGDIFRIIYGRADGRKDNEVLFQVETDLREAGIEPLYSSEVRRDTFRKFSMVSPMACVGAYYDVSAKEVKKEGRIREHYRSCVNEIGALAGAMGVPLEDNIAQINLDIMDGLSDDATASMQKDLKKGGKSEIDGLLFEVIRMGRRYNVPLPAYEKIAEKFADMED